MRSVRRKIDDCRRGFVIINGLGFNIEVYNSRLLRLAELYIFRHFKRTTMKNQLPRLLFILTICLYTVACSSDDADLGYYIVETSTEIAQESTLEFEPEIILSQCFDNGAMCAIDNPGDEAFGYNWSHNDMSLGHDSKTPCLCGGMIKVRVTRHADGLSHTTSVALPHCKEQIK